MQGNNNELFIYVSAAQYSGNGMLCVPAVHDATVAVRFAFAEFKTLQKERIATHRKVAFLKAKMHQISFLPGLQPEPR